jgi:heterotetrameric sarcosine oxidase gamma subunit
VAELIAKPALPGRAPLIRGALRLSEAPFVPMTSIAMFPGQDKALAKVLKPLGLIFPAPNRVVQKDSLRLVWTGRDQAFLIGEATLDMPDSVAAVTDQSDGWATLVLEGPGAADALMRHVPVDLRLAQFPVGQVRRAPLYHMQAILLRPTADRFEILIFRSMARTAWHDIDVAMTTIEARTARAR